MHRHQLYEVSASDYRIRYAIRTILRDRAPDEGAFKVCFEMEDEELVIRTILRRGIRNRKMRTALERSHLIDLTHWLLRFPDLAEAYSDDVDSGSQGIRRLRPMLSGRPPTQ